MAYYHDLITEKSWRRLQELKRKHNFVLIGGWAVYLYTKGLKSRDIDFICDYDELEKLKNEYDLIKNDRLKKYEIHDGEFDIDIYVPFFSDLGLPTEELSRMVQAKDGIVVLNPEPLLILKQNAYRSRAHSAKGEKDRIDIIALLISAADIGLYKNLLKKFNIERYADDIRVVIGQTRDVPELGIKEHSFSKTKRRILAELGL
ncbi:MAG: hypothetical protein AAB592_02000 [Patescibacteria group bacterium]